MGIGTLIEDEKKRGKIKDLWMWTSEMTKKPWKVINMEEERRDGLERLSTRQECGSKKVRGTKRGRERGVQALTKAGQRS